MKESRNTGNCRNFVRPSLSHISHHYRRYHDSQKRRKSSVSLVWLDGGYTWSGRCVSFGFARRGLVHNGFRKLYCCAGGREVDYFCYHDSILCFALLCVEAALPRQRQWRFNRRCLSAGGCSDCFVHDAAKPMASADAPISWGIYRNIPFALLGLLIIVLFYQSAKKHQDKAFRWMWITIVLSFGFYIPVVLWADTIPLIGMLMIPKTCAYVWTILIGYFAMKKECQEKGK